MKEEGPYNRITAPLLAGSATRLLAYAFVLLLAYFLTGCANPIPPTGGPRDTTPPKLDTLYSTRNMQTLFEKQTIVLAFNEWVELRDVFNQVIVSPPLEYRPTIERKKRTIQFEFDDREVLRDSATYVVNFGESIRDITEGNVAPVVFVFSTGEYIDSLTVEGEVVDAYTNEPVKDVLFMLYENLEDSVFRKDRPFYFARTDEQGKFKVSNVKSGTFKGTALVDQNLNYRFDNEAEKIAFLDSTITLEGVAPKIVDTSLVLKDSMLTDTLMVDSLALPSDSLVLNKDTLTPDSLIVDSLELKVDSIPAPSTSGFRSRKNQRLTLRLFEEEKKLFLQDDETGTYGLVKLEFNREPYDAEVSYDSIGQFVVLENDVDSIKLWYFMEEEQAFNIYVQRDTIVDTIKVESGLKSDFYGTAVLKPMKKAPSRLPVVSPDQSFEMEVNHPLSSIDASLIRLFEDSIRTEVTALYFIDTLAKRKFNVKHAWQENTKYEVVISPGGITDMYGIGNVDTIRREWVSGAEKDFGTLTLQVKNLKPDTGYVIRLLAKNESVYESFQVRDSSEFKTVLYHVPPDVYSVEMIEDVDKNGRWTSGNYDLKRQPERVRKTTIEEVRANWEVNAEVIWEDRITTSLFVPPSGTPSSTNSSDRPPGQGGQGGRGRQ